MPSNLFPYPGGKALLAPWIVEHFPSHECYVEPFGGGASVLTTKPESKVEVYNDIDGDLVHFFRTFRDRTEELIQFIKNTPASREIHSEWAEQFYNGECPDDDVERAARFFYLRFTQFGGFYDGERGFRSFKHRSVGRQMNNAADELRSFADRLRDLTVENRDYEALKSRYDGEKTLWYIDAPYVEEGDDLYRHEGEFDHNRLVEFVGGLEGDFVMSYHHLPDGLSEYNVVERGVKYDNRHGGEQPDATERLVMNFDPEEKTPHTDASQTTASDFL